MGRRGKESCAKSMTAAYMRHQMHQIQMYLEANQGRGGKSRRAERGGGGRILIFGEYSLMGERWWWQWRRGTLCWLCWWLDEDQVELRPLGHQPYRIHIQQCK